MDALSRGSRVDTLYRGGWIDALSRSGCGWMDA